MDFFTVALFFPASFALNMVPGPNNLLSMANAQVYGFKCAFVAGIGRILAFSVMIILAATGLASVLHASEVIFQTIKILGAFYLLWVAYKLWSSETLEGDVKHSDKNLYQLGKQEFLLAAGNPKAILIFTAFLPQFVDPTKSASYQLMILGVIFLFLELIAISLYAFFGIYLRRWFSRPKMKKLFNRCCAFFIGSMGISLIAENET